MSFQALDVISVACDTYSSFPRRRYRRAESADVSEEVPWCCDNVEVISRVLNTRKLFPCRIQSWMSSPTIATPQFVRISSTQSRGKCRRLQSGSKSLRRCEGHLQRFKQLQVIFVSFPELEVISDGCHSRSSFARCSLLSEESADVPKRFHSAAFTWKSSPTF